MKRSEINNHLQYAMDFLARNHFPLPPFAAWTPADWQCRGHDADEIRSRRLGWDVTDFGSNDFLHVGLTIFALRNGLFTDPGNQKIYAEKILIVREGQITPLHFHFQKTEDIINRGAGRLVVELFNSNAAQQREDSPITVSCDGMRRSLPPGGTITLNPGESITLPPHLYHQFYAKPGDGTALIGEVSSINDDATDNRFYQPLPRYPAIQEDQPPLRYLCFEYPPAT